MPWEACCCIERIKGIRISKISLESTVMLLLLNIAKDLLMVFPQVNWLAHLIIELASSPVNLCLLNQSRDRLNYSHGRWNQITWSVEPSHVVSQPSHMVFVGNQSHGQLNQSHGRLNQSHGRLNQSRGRVNHSRSRFNKSNGRLNQSRSRLNQSPGPRYANQVMW